MAGTLSEDQIQMEMVCFRPQTGNPKVWLPMDGSEKLFVDYAGTVSGPITLTGAVSPIADGPPVQGCGG